MARTRERVAVSREKGGKRTMAPVVRAEVEGGWFGRKEGVELDRLEAEERASCGVWWLTSEVRVRVKDLTGASRLC